MITPTPGRIVWFTPFSGDEEIAQPDKTQPLAGIVTYVWNDRLINVTVFDQNGAVHPRTSVQLLQDDDEGFGGAAAAWMP